MNNMKKVTLGNFKRNGEPGSFAHCFSYKMPDGRELCLESCLNGYDVALYDSNQNLIGEKICTNLEGMLESQIAPGFSILTGKAIEKALKIANNLMEYGWF